MLPQIDVEQSCRLASSLDESLDGGPGGLETLAKRAETDRIAALGQALEGVVPIEAIPGHVLDDFVFRLGAAQRDFHRAGGCLRVALERCGVHTARLQSVDQRLTKLIVANPAGHHRVSPEESAYLVRLHGGVERCAAQHWSDRQQIV